MQSADGLMSAAIESIILEKITYDVKFALQMIFFVVVGFWEIAAPWDFYIFAEFATGKKKTAWETLD